MQANQAITRIKIVNAQLKANQRPLYLMTVGLPGSGKSTFLKKVIDEIGPLEIASTDDLIDREADKLGITYSEAFKRINFKTLQKEARQTVEKAVLAKKNIANDQTNCGTKSRRTKLETIPSAYYKIALVFDVPDNVLRQRLDKRAEETGKIIPPYVVSQMAANWNHPTKSEGFDEIIEISNV